MGQRHQLFVIAKIANRYRGLAVFHHQWLYGARALKQCLALLTIFSAPANRLAILQELAAARRHSESFWTTPCNHDNSEVPFPFITTCLLLGASFNVKEGYNADLVLEPFNMAFNGGDNNDGITIIDITDLSHVRYCFVLWAGRDVFHFDEVEGPHNVLQMRPLSGPTYLGAYYNAKQREMRAELQLLMQQYDHWDLIKVDALADTWPKGKWVGAGSELGGDADIATAIPTPTLRQSALTRLVETSLQSVDTDLSWITEPELLPDFLPAIRTKLGSEPTLIASPAAKALLLRAIKHEQEVDLSQFPDLSMDDLVSLTSKLSNKTTSLSLSGPNVTAAFLVQELLAVNTSLRKLYVLDAPNLQLQSTLRLMYQPRSPWIYHSDMFSTLLHYQTLSNRNRRNANDRDTHQPNSNEIQYIAGGSVKFPVVQIFWLSRKFETVGNTSRLDDGGIPWAQLLPPQDRYDYLLEPFVAAFPLRDALLPTTRVVTGLAKFGHYLTESDNFGFGMSKEGTIGMAAAKCFALAASDLGELDIMKQVEVRPLPEELFTTAKEMLASSAGPPAPELQPLKPGEWTIVIAHEPRDMRAKRQKHPTEERLRYAFLTTSDPAASGESDAATMSSPATRYDGMKAQRGRHGVVIADMKIFLERVMNDDSLAQEGLLNFWNEATRGLVDEFGVCGTEEIASILEVMPEYSRRRIGRLNEWRKFYVASDETEEPEI